MKSRAAYIKETLRDVQEAIAVLEYSSIKTAEMFADKILLAMQNDETMHPKTREMIRSHLSKAPANTKAEFVAMVINNLEQIDPTGTCSAATITADNAHTVFIAVNASTMDNMESLNGVVAYKSPDEPVEQKKNGTADTILKVECPYAEKMGNEFVIEDFSKCKIVGQVGSTTECVGKRYTPFLAKHYAISGKPFSIFVSPDMSEYLADFDRLKNKKLLGAYSSDAMSYKSIDDFFEAVDTQRHLLAKREEEEMTKRGQASMEYENAHVRIVIPEDEKAACYYGRGTIWCTSALVHNEFKKYQNAGSLFILIPKSPEYTNEKYQIFFGGDGHDPEFKNESEKEVDDIWLLSERFGNLISEYFKDQTEYKFWAENY